MKNTISLLALIFSLSNTFSESKMGLQTISGKESINEHSIKVYNYPSLTIPQFFKTLIKNHAQDFYRIDSTAYIAFCGEHNINPADSSNVSKYFSLTILHKLWTSESASNCSRGEILDIPYQWHWVSPNPRHAIYDVKSGRRLTEIKPERAFSRYQSCADIDRTPYLFISDLISEKPKYYSASCDTFSTFGWCSEREMAFVALTHLLGFEGKVVAEGNHSWSEFIVPFTLHNHKNLNLTVRIDNTFDLLEWSAMPNQHIAEWKKYYGNTSQSSWYNQKAKAQNELNSIKNHIVHAVSMATIENKVVTYLRKLL